jgi:predicted enzyme related to lactoylglutathione lyase
LREAAHVFQGLRTVIYSVADLDKAKEWYTQVLGRRPYFSEAFYVGFNVGGFELGLDPDTSAVRAGDNAVAYWGVPDCKSAYARLLEMGATVHTPVRDVGDGIQVGTVVDPFGNTVGVIENPHFSLPADHESAHAR